MVLHPAQSDFYPRPPRGGRRYKVDEKAMFYKHFYPRPPRGGRRRSISYSIFCGRFLSTPSARRATQRRTSSVDMYQFLSTPSARRATAEVQAGIPSLCNFYPRPPRGGRPAGCPRRWAPRLFLSTPSARRATLFGREDNAPSLISIHALREEGDLRNRQKQHFCAISIHALREEGDCSRPPMWATPTIFLSTPSARRATR